MKKTIILLILFISSFQVFSQNIDVFKIKKQVNIKFKNELNSYVKFHNLNKPKEVILLRLDSIYPNDEITTRLYFYNECTKKTIKVSPLVKIQKLYRDGYNDFEFKYDDLNDNILIVGRKN